MAFNNEIYQSSWGDMVIFVANIEWEAGESQVEHTLAAGDIYPLQRRGKQFRKATAKLIFDDFDGVGDDGITLFRKFEATTSERRIFTHPIDGSYLARVGKCTPRLDESSIVEATVEFLPDAAVEPVQPNGSGRGGTPGETAVAAASDEMAAQLSDVSLGFTPSALPRLSFSKSVEADVDLAFAPSISASASANVSASATASVALGATASVTASAQASIAASALSFANVYGRATHAAQTSPLAQKSSMPSPAAFAFAYAAAALDRDARGSINSWTQNEDTTNRQIMIDAARLSDSIVTMIEIGGFEDDLDLWPAYKAAVMLGDAIRSAAVAATSETPSVFVIIVREPIGLLPLASKIYGGQDAQRRARQMESLNDIRTRGWLEPGAYLAPTPPPGSRSQGVVG